MLASLRHLLHFIDLDTTFDNYGFTKKVGPICIISPTINRLSAFNVLFRHKLLAALLYSFMRVFGALNTMRLILLSSCSSEAVRSVQRLNCIENSAKGVRYLWLSGRISR